MGQNVDIWWLQKLQLKELPPFLSSAIAKSNNSGKWGSIWPGTVIERKIILYLSEALKHLARFNLVHMGNKMKRRVDSNFMTSHFTVHSLYFCNPFDMCFYFWMQNGIHYINEMSHLVTVETLFLQPAKN